MQPYRVPPDITGTREGLFEKLVLTAGRRTLLRRLPVIVRYLASTVGFGCDRAPDALSSRMARDHPRRTKRKVSATAQGNETAARPPSTRDAGDGRPCESLVVIDDLPAKIAIPSRELGVIEAFLGALLDELLK